MPMGMVKLYTIRYCLVIWITLGCTLSRPRIQGIIHNSAAAAGMPTTMHMVTALAAISRNSSSSPFPMQTDAEMLNALAQSLKKALISQHTQLTHPTEARASTPTYLPSTAASVMEYSC